MTDVATSAETSPKAEPRRRRRWWIPVVSVVGALAVLLGAGYLWLMSGASVQAVGESDCEDVPTESGMSRSDESQARTGVCAAIGRLSTAWEQQDAEAYGAVFTENATYTTFAGTYYAGREDIVRSHAALYDGPLSGTRLTDSFLDLRFLAEEVAVLTTRGDTYEADEPGEPTKVQTYTLIREDDQWSVASFHNTQRSDLMEQVQFRWMPETRPGAER